jgi:sarcosine oxidase subunit alpha
VFGGPLIAAANGERLYRIRARHLVFATGAVEQARGFPNNDLPGVMLSSAVDLLVDALPRAPGRPRVVLTASAKGYETAAPSARPAPR